MTTECGTRGEAPSVMVKPYNPEQAKYAKVWEKPEYRIDSPGEQWSQLFLHQAQPPMNSEAIDFGTGTGRGALMLALMGCMKVTMLDFATNCLDPEVAQACETQPTRLKFFEQDLTQPIAHTGAYGYCCDVMEHIPTKDVKTVLRNILSSAQHVFFGISTVPDNLGKLIGETLHLTVEPMQWWIKEIQDLGAMVHWTKELDGACAIYCSAWGEAGELIKTGKVNVADDTVNAQVKANVEAGWDHVRPHDTQDREVILLAGGPSMATSIDKILELRANGAAIFTVNGAYHWAIRAGLGDQIGAQIVLDAREFNSRFVEPVLPQCRYLIASQVHPGTLAGLPKDKTLLWHSGVSDQNEQLIREKQDGLFFPTPGGSTVTLRAIPLLRMLGFKRFHIFGFDSCVNTTDGKHHAYDQKENDCEPVIPVTCGGRMFLCTPWMTSQASEFRDLVKFLGDEVELAVYGDGLIAHIIETGASFSKE